MARLMLSDEGWSKLQEIMLQHGIYDKPNLRMMVEAILCLYKQLLRNVEWFCFLQNFLLRFTQLNTESNYLTQPLRSTAITAASSLIRVAPSQCFASVLSPLEFRLLGFLP